MKHAALEIFKNVLFGIGTALATLASLFVLIQLSGFNPETVVSVVGTVTTGAAFYFVGKEIREKFFKYK